jgi:Double zinc ribbon
MFCPSCACELPAVAKFCVRCGAPTGFGAVFPMEVPPVLNSPGLGHEVEPEPASGPTYCGSCGARAVAGNQFCAACGAPIHPADVPIGASVHVRSIPGMAGGTDFPKPGLVAPQASPSTEQGIATPLDESSRAPSPLFAVSLLKLAVMSVCTFGIYELYWFYRNWRRIQERDRSDISPFWRAFFGLIFCYSLFKRVRKDGEDRRLTSPPSMGLLAVFYILTTICWRLPNPFDLISMLSFLFLLPVQSYVNRINSADSPNHDPNSRFGIWNWIGVCVGGVLFVLAVIGSFMPDS